MSTANPLLPIGSILLKQIDCSEREVSGTHKNVFTNCSIKTRYKSEKERERESQSKNI
jgi:hypothetical protein